MCFPPKMLAEGFDIVFDYKRETPRCQTQRYASVKDYSLQLTMVYGIERNKFLKKEGET